VQPVAIPYPAQTPEWWRSRLLERYKSTIEERRGYWSVYQSRTPLVHIPDRLQQAYQRLLRMSSTPWARLVVDIVAERILMQGDRLDNNPEEPLWKIMRQSQVDTIQRQVYRESAAVGTSYVSVWLGDSNPQLRYESALHTVHETKAGDPNQVAAALKVWVDTVASEVRCNLYLPDAVWRWRSDNTNIVQEWNLAGMDSTLWTNTVWEQMESYQHKFGMVMVPFVTSPNDRGYGVSDLSGLYAILQRLEYITSNVLLATELGAFRQKWATGLDIPKDENGKPIEPFSVALDRLWTSADPETKFGSFEATDINAYLKAVSDAVGQLSAVSRIPMHYLVQTELANPPSAESLEASELGLISKAKERREIYSDSWEQITALVMAMTDDPVGDRVIEVLWKDPRARAETSVMQAATMMQSLGVPWEFIMEYIGYSPSDIARMESMRAADMFTRLVENSLNPPGIQIPGQGEQFQQRQLPVVPNPT
jgi:hypothetical protein